MARPAVSATHMVQTKAMPEAHAQHVPGSSLHAEGVHHAKLAKEASLQVLQEVLEAMTESAKKQQQTRDEVQERLDEEASASGSHKQRSKDLSERLRMEDTKLQRKQQNLKEAESLRDRWHGEHSVI